MVLHCCNFFSYLNLYLFTIKLVHRVTLADQSTYDAKVVGFDQDKDVAVLRVDAPKDKLRPIPIGVSADLLVGQKVYAIGNPVSTISCLQARIKPLGLKHAVYCLLFFFLGFKKSISINCRIYSLTLYVNHQRIHLCPDSEELVLFPQLP